MFCYFEFSQTFFEISPFLPLFTTSTNGLVFQIFFFDPSLYIILLKNFTKFLINQKSQIVNFNFSLQQSKVNIPTGSYWLAFSLLLLLRPSQSTCGLCPELFHTPTAQFRRSSLKLWQPPDPMLTLLRFAPGFSLKRKPNPNQTPIKATTTTVIG